jgi:gliding motility-associated-like protein
MFTRSLHISLILFFALTCTVVFSQQRIFYTVSGGDLYAMDPLNCTNDFIGSTGIGFGDIAFTSDGRLWGISQGDLYRIDTVTASTQLIGPIGVHSVSLVGVNDSILLTESMEDLYQINVNTVNSNFIGHIGYSAGGDLVMVNDIVFMISPLVKIQLNENFSQIIKVSLIDINTPPSEGSAVMDNTCYPIVSFSAIGTINVNQENGNYNLICSNLNISGVPGAASIPKIKSSNDEGMINVFTPNDDGINDYFQPKESIEDIKSVTILNRWGETVNTLDYPYIWNGSTKEGIQLHEGVYYYVINQEIGCKQNEVKQNMIHLIR